MTTLLIALGILAAFGALFWIDTFNTGVKKEDAESGDSRRDSIEP
jgi:hypothetical protein